MAAGRAPTPLPLTEQVAGSYKRCSAASAEGRRCTTRWRRAERAAFIYFGDQFINFAKGRRQGPDQRRHFGIAVDDKELARQRLEELGITFLDGPFTDFLDPWGNRVEITTYAKISAKPLLPSVP